MAFKVVITQTANTDLQEIIDFLKTQHPGSEGNIAHGLIGKVKYLAEFPLLGHSFSDSTPSDLREVAFKGYKIFYRIKREECRVEVLRFWPNLDPGVNSGP